MRDAAAIDSKWRQALFLDLAAQPDGVTAQDVHEEAGRRGDTATVEAYLNLGRRLTIRGRLRSAKGGGGRTRYHIGERDDEQWLDEDRLADLLDPEYPLIALSLVKEASRQLAGIPEAAWAEIRERLKGENAQALFFDAVKGYAVDLCDALQEYILDETSGSRRLPEQRARIEAQIVALKQLTKFGLGLSQDAVRVPPGLEAALGWARGNPNAGLVDEEVLRDELSRRVSPEQFLVEIDQRAQSSEKPLIVAAVDGSTRGGLLALDGEDGDLAVGLAPSVSINTAAAQLNRNIRTPSGRTHPAFLRLPEKPEDVQRRENRYSIMARLLFPDLSEAQYAHSIWNAMNLLECRAAHRAMQRWDSPDHQIEMPPADVILMDGTIAPNDRDSNHYGQSDSYGRIVRDLIGANADILRRSRDDRQVVAGAVKNQQLRVLAPVINFFVAQVVAGGEDSQIRSWPLQAMSALPDQHLLTRILTAGRLPHEPWVRTCFVLRPFHAVTDFADRYYRTRRPADELVERANNAQARLAKGESTVQDEFWASAFDPIRDPFLKLLEGAWYGMFFLGALPRLDGRHALPRVEMLVPHSTREEGEPWPAVEPYAQMLISALRQVGFEVAADHDMFDGKGRLDIMPKLLIDAHNTVKQWAAVPFCYRAGTHSFPD